MSKLVYLHGFASSPASTKARYLVRRFAALGIAMEIPDLAQGDFERLTITGQLRVIDDTVCGKPATLIGSSLGGYLAALYAARHPEIERMVLLAPAFQFAARWKAHLGQEQIEAWRETDSLEVYHYGFETKRRLRYQFIEDAADYEDFPKVTQPCLILHGIKDDIVPWELSQEFAARNEGARLDVLESDHQLLDVIDLVWERIRGFLF